MPSSRALVWLRWAAVLPFALIAAAGAQLVAMKVGGTAIFSFESMRSPDGFYLDGPWWALKSGASLFMGAAFVAGGTWTAPTHQRYAAIGLAAVVIAWGGMLMSGGPQSWGAVMGSLGAAGAVGVLAAVWWRTRETALAVTA